MKMSIKERRAEFQKTYSFATAAGFPFSLIHENNGDCDELYAGGKA